MGLALVALALGGFLGAGCSSGSGVRPSAEARAGRAGSYAVRRGDTLYVIAQRYGTSVHALIAANGITNPRRLQIGRVLVIPGASTRGSTAYASTGQAIPDFTHDPAAPHFLWPVEHGVISSGFGIRHGTMHDGVDIAAAVGTPVRAAAAGLVIFAGRLRGYGRVVIIRHNDHYVTVYGHDHVNLVREGQHVKRGEVIGELGRSGRATGPNLHFEVRRDNIAHNPLAYLPSPANSDGISFASNAGG